jgi:hypothetical protein
MCQFGALSLRRRFRGLEPGLPQHRDDIGHRRTTAEFAGRSRRRSMPRCGFQPIASGLRQAYRREGR